MVVAVFEMRGHTVAAQQGPHTVEALASRSGKDGSSS